MYTPLTIQDSIFGNTPLIGWRQEEDPSQSQLDSSLVTSVSGRYFQDAHPALTLKNIFSFAPRFADYVYPTWSNVTTYTVGTITKLGSVNYICIQASTGNSPDASPTYWTAFTLGNEKSRWLKNKTRAYVLNVMDDFLEQKNWGRTTKSILDEVALFDGSQYEGELQVSESKTVGFLLKPMKSLGVTVKIGKLGLQFSEVGDVTVHLYHSSQSDPVESKTVTITEANSMQWFDFDWDLPYLSSYDAGGTWSIEYDQDLVNGQAINKARDWSIAPTNGFHYSNGNLLTEFLEVHPFTIETGNRANPSLREFLYDTNFGINMVVSAHCDYTDFFVRQNKSFTNALIKGVGRLMLRELALNPHSRVALTEASLSRDQLLYELDGNTQGRPTGIGHEYNQALKSIQIDLQGLCEDCFPSNKKGVKMKTIG